MPDDCAGISVAIVDDDPQLTMIYQHIFIHRRIPVAFVAHDGPAALQMFREADPKPPIAIVDYHMPGMNGIELMRELFKLAPGTKFLFISADDSVRQETLKAGASAFLNKPARINDIMDNINALAGR